MQLWLVSLVNDLVNIYRKNLLKRDNALNSLNNVKMLCRFWFIINGPWLKSIYTNYKPALGKIMLVKFSFFFLHCCNLNDVDPSGHAYKRWEIVDSFIRGIWRNNRTVITWYRFSILITFCLLVNFMQWTVSLETLTDLFLNPDSIYAWNCTEIKIILWWNHIYRISSCSN
jgi:hypothetical protein